MGFSWLDGRVVENMEYDGGILQRRREYLSS